MGKCASERGIVREGGELWKRVLPQVGRVLVSCTARNCDSLDRTGSEDSENESGCATYLSRSSCFGRHPILLAVTDCAAINSPSPALRLCLLALYLQPLTPSFDDNACVLLNNKGDMLGTRVNGVVAQELRNAVGGADPNGRWSKILALAPKVSRGAGGRLA